MNRYDDLDKVWDDRTFKAYADFTDHPVKTTLVWVGTVLALLLALSLIGNALGIANIYWQAEQAKLTINPRVTRTTYSTQNALVNIAYYHNQCNTITVDEAQVANAAAALASDKQQFAAATDPITQSQLGSQVSTDNTNLFGIKNQLQNDVGDYNAKSATQTSNPFKANNLPYRIVVNTDGKAIDSITHQPVNCH